MSAFDPASIVAALEALGVAEPVRTHEVPHDAVNASVHLVNYGGVSDTLTAPASKGSRYVSVSNSSLFPEGSKVRLPTGDNREFDILTVKAIDIPAANDIQFDRPLDADKSISDAIQLVEHNLKVAGSPAAPIKFSYRPDPGDSKRITALHIVIQTTTEPDLIEFGGVAALAYGIHFYKESDIGRNYTIWTALRSNVAFKLSGFSYETPPKVPSGNYYTLLTYNVISENASVFNINDDESLVVAVQDDLSADAAFVSMEVKMSMYSDKYKVT